MAAFPVPGDWRLNATGTDIELVSGADAAAQSIQIGVETIAPYYVFDQSAGIPYFDKIFGSNPDLGSIRRLLTDFMLSFPDVARVDTLELDLDKTSRELQVHYSVTLNTGESFSDDIIYGRTD